MCFSFEKLMEYFRVLAIKSIFYYNRKGLIRNREVKENEAVI